MASADKTSNRYYGRKRSYTSLTADIEEFVATCDKRMTALMRMSLQDVIDEAQLPTAKGGRMRVDTGFLRASGQASLNGMPTGPGRGELTAKNSYTSNDSAVEVQLGKLKLGATFFFGWTANYAQYRELYDGFLEGALRNWSRIVTFNTDSIRQRIK